MLCALEISNEGVNCPGNNKRLAGVLAWWVPGTRDVVNGLEEVPAEEDNDDELTDAVRLALEKDPFVDATQIRVTTKDWIVTLDGLVPKETMKNRWPNAMLAGMFSGSKRSSIA